MFFRRSRANATPRHADKITACLVRGCLFHRNWLINSWPTCLKARSLSARPAADLRDFGKHVEAVMCMMCSVYMAIRRNGKRRSGKRRNEKRIHKRKSNNFNKITHSFSLRYTLEVAPPPPPPPPPPTHTHMKVMCMCLHMCIYRPIHTHTNPCKAIHSYIHSNYIFLSHTLSLSLCPSPVPPPSLSLSLSQFNSFQRLYCP